MTSVSLRGFVQLFIPLYVKRSAERAGEGEHTRVQGSSQARVPSVSRLVCGEGGGGSLLQAGNRGLELCLRVHKQRRAGAEMQTQASFGAVPVLYPSTPDFQKLSNKIRKINMCLSKPIWPYSKLEVTH